MVRGGLTAFGGTPASGRCVLRPGKLRVFVIKFLIFGCKGVNLRLVCQKPPRVPLSVNNKSRSAIAQVADPLRKDAN